MNNLVEFQMHNNDANKRNKQSNEVACWKSSNNIVHNDY